MTLRLFGVEPASIFGLRGTDENSATYALGWAIDRGPSFRAALLTDLTGKPFGDTDDTVVDLQRYDEHGGFTDIEVHNRDACHLIIEAKCGWTLPSRSQLETYARRLASPSKVLRGIVSLSGATRDYAMRRLPGSIADIPLTHRSWAEIKRLADAAHRAASSYEEKLWLRHFSRHLEDYVSMQNPRDNLVFVVSLSAEPIRDGDDYTWIDVVEKDGQYFHPVGNRWPVSPPNYIGFRYCGELQSVHHIVAYEIVTDLSERNLKWPETENDHFVYRLGPAMKPARPLRTGRIYRNHRVRCAIDTLLSGVFDTISAARDETDRRLSQVEKEANQ